MIRPVGATPQAEASARRAAVALALVADDAARPEGAGDHRRADQELAPAAVAHQCADPDLAHGHADRSGPLAPMSPHNTPPLPVARAPVRPAVMRRQGRIGRGYARYPIPKP